MRALPTPERVAAAFARVLQGRLTPDEWREMRRRNATPRYRDGLAGTGPCASQDFCDANEAMLEALRRCGVRRRPRGEGGPLDPVTSLWNEAWRVAKRQHLSARPRAPRRPRGSLRRRRARR